MKKTHFFIWLAIMILFFSVWFSWEFLCYTIFLLIASYMVFAISDVKDKKILDKFNKRTDLYAKYFFAVFALFSAYLLLAKQTIPSMDLTNYIIIWYFSLSIFLMGVFLIPAGHSLYDNPKSTFARLWILLGIFIFGYAFSGLTAVINVGTLGLNIFLDTYLFSLLSYLELGVLFWYIFWFYRIDLRIK